MSVSKAQSEGITMSGGGLYSLATTGRPQYYSLLKQRYL